MSNSPSRSGNSQTNRQMVKCIIPLRRVPEAPLGRRSGGRAARGPGRGARRGHPCTRWPDPTPRQTNRRPAWRLRGHPTEYGVVAPQGRSRIRQLAGVLEAGDCGLPEAVVELGWLLLGRIDELDEKIDGPDRKIRKIRTSAREREQTARLMTIPGIGPITALALQAFAPPMESFRRGRDFPAWLGLVPRQHTTGEEPTPGRISKMGRQRIARGLVRKRESSRVLQGCTTCTPCSRTVSGSSLLHRRDNRRQTAGDSRCHIPWPERRPISVAASGSRHQHPSPSSLSGHRRWFPGVVQRMVIRGFAKPPHAAASPAR